MVHFSATILVFAALVTTSFAAPTRRDISQIVSDISEIGEKVRNLDTSITSATANGTVGLAGANDIGQAVIEVEIATVAATNDLKNATLLSDADADTLIQTLQPVAQNVIDTIRELIRTKKAFDNGPVGDSPFVLLLQNLQLDTNDFQVALNAIIPPDQEQTVVGINTQVSNIIELALELFGGK